MYADDLGAAFLGDFFFALSAMGRLGFDGFYPVSKVLKTILQEPGTRTSFLVKVPNEKKEENF